jgi:hypothetical protein
MTTTDEEENVNSDYAEDQDRRRKKAYKVYKHYSKPTRASMCSIVDSHAEDTGITRQDVDLLPWNPEETEVIKEAMKSLKKKKEKEGKKDKKKKKDKKAKKKDKEEEEIRDGTEKTAFAKLKGKMGYVSTSLDSSWNAISDSLDASSTSISQDQDLIQDHNESAGQLQTISVEEQHNRKREERRRRREEEKKKSFSEVDEQKRIAAEERKREDARNKMIQARQNDRLECTFLRYTRMGQPTRAEFEQQILSQNVDISPEDVDLLAWNEDGTRVKNLATMNAMLVRTRILKNSETQLPVLC